MKTVVEEMLDSDFEFNEWLCGFLMRYVHEHLLTVLKHFTGEKINWFVQFRMMQHCRFKGKYVIQNTHRNAPVRNTLKHLCSLGLHNWSLQLSYYSKKRHIWFNVFLINAIWMPSISWNTFLPWNPKCYPDLTELLSCFLFQGESMYKCMYIIIATKTFKNVKGCNQQLDYCNFLYMKLPLKTLWKLHLIKHVAAWIVMACQSLLI